MVKPDIIIDRINRRIGELRDSNDYIKSSDQGAAFDACLKELKDIRAFIQKKIAEDDKKTAKGKPSVNLLDEALEDQVQKESGDEGD